MNVHRITDKNPTDSRGRRWMPADEWFALWERANDPDSRYGRYGRNPADIVVKVVKAA